MEYEGLSNFTVIHKLSKGTAILLLCVVLHFTV